jgi:hypothetical protein
MTGIGELHSYAELRPLIPPAAFKQTMNFLAWHNRQKMTPMLEVWQALIVGLAFESADRQIDSTLYPVISKFLRQSAILTPLSLESARQSAQKLASELST